MSVPKRNYGKKKEPKGKDPGWKSLYTYAARKNGFKVAGKGTTRGDKSTRAEDQPGRQGIPPST